MHHADLLRDFLRSRRSAVAIVGVLLGLVAAIAWTAAAETLFETLQSFFPFVVVGLLGFGGLVTSRVRLEDGLFFAGLAIGPALFTNLCVVHEYWCAAVLFASIGLVVSLIKRSVAVSATGRCGSVVAALSCLVVLAAVFQSSSLGRQCVAAGGRT